MSLLRLSSSEDQCCASFDQIDMTSAASGDVTKRFISDELRANVLGLKDKILRFREIPKKGEILDPAFQILQRGNNTVFKNHRGRKFCLQAWKCRIKIRKL